jgi:hypothetical protein
MRFPFLLSLVLFAVAAATLTTGCETVDRMHYNYEPNPVRIKDPGLVQPPVKPEAEAEGEPVPATVL